MKTFSENQLAISLIPLDLLKGEHSAISIGVFMRHKNWTVERDAGNRVTVKKLYCQPGR